MRVNLTEVIKQVAKFNHAWEELEEKLKENGLIGEQYNPKKHMADLSPYLGQQYEKKKKNEQ